MSEKSSFIKLRIEYCKILNVIPELKDIFKHILGGLFLGRVDIGGGGFYAEGVLC